MTKRILKALLMVSTIVLLLAVLLTMGILYHYFGRQLEKELKMEAEYLAIAVEREGIAALEELPAEAERVTYIDAQGNVLYDSVIDTASMDNHKNRAEIRKAMETGRGTAVRESDTLSEKTIYYAVRLKDGNILRVSSVQYNAAALLGGLMQPMLYVVVLMLCLSAWMALRLSKKILEPVNCLDLEHPEENQVYDEIAPLVLKISRQKKSLEREIQKAKQQQKEFALITENMEEGFLVIDIHTEVLSYNSSALRLLGAEEQEGHQSVLALNRSEGFQSMIEHVLEGRHVATALELAGRSCQAAANPVWQDNKVTGAILLLLDVTERMKGEQMRREFTANVSHELKTPLTSISGFAEIIQDGFVKPEDTKKFAGRIFKEAQRLITLVNDVIKISQLDEGKIFYEKECVDLYEIARETLKRLQEQAEQAGIQLYLYGSHRKLHTVKAVLEEVVYNLCDNGLKYNQRGGSLTITLSEEDNRSKMSIEDTGIGISQENQSRIFERFYRVDKSHSKEIGGTGLGLSIVKHGSQFLGAEIEVQSTPNQGSCFSLLFPEENSCS